MVFGDGKNYQLNGSSMFQPKGINKNPEFPNPILLKMLIVYKLTISDENQDLFQIGRTSPA